MTERFYGLGIAVTAFLTGVGPGARLGTGGLSALRQLVTVPAVLVGQGNFLRLAQGQGGVSLERRDLQGGIYKFSLVGKADCGKGSVGRDGSG